VKRGSRNDAMIDIGITISRRRSITNYKVNVELWTGLIAKLLKGLKRVMLVKYICLSYVVEQQLVIESLVRT
jgi:hypothetical protein